MYSKIKIKFVISPYRRNYRDKGIDATLSNYWSDMYNEMFRGWK